MKNRICRVCSEIYTGRSDSFFCKLACKSKWHRAKKAQKAQILRQDVVYLAEKVQSLSKLGNNVSERYLSEKDAQRLKGIRLK